MNKIEYQARKAIYDEVIKDAGPDHQLMKCIEEMSELTKEICKSFIPGGTTLDKIADECADVLITLEQLRIIFDMNDAVSAHMDTKIEQLHQRLLENRL